MVKLRHARETLAGSREISPPAPDVAGRARLRSGFWRRCGALGLVAALAGCGGGGGGLPDGADVVTPDFESYVTNHNGYSRVRLDRSTTADAGIIAQFEDSDPATPSGYKQLIDLGASYSGKMTIEVIAEVDEADGDKVKRILRLTADQSPFENVQNGRLVTASGKFYLRGQNFNWVTIGAADPLSGAKPEAGLENLMLDFDAETADITLRTGVEGNSEVRTEIVATGLPFNIVTGAYGGDVTIRIWDPTSALIFAIDGSLRGGIGGSTAYTNGAHGLTTSGLYTATGTDHGVTVRVDGVYFGIDPNAIP